MASSTPDLAPAWGERVARRDRLLVAAGIAALSGLAWLDLLAGAGMSMAPRFAVVAAMWWVMMVAMMLPSAAPAILLYARVRRHRGDPAIASATLFLAGYLLAWSGFALVAAAAEAALGRAGWIDGMALRLAAPRAGAFLLLAAGAYQLTGWKNACLAQCRSPAAFLARHWRPGAAGAVRLGLLHGAACVGCCWLLMILLFVGGVMNLAVVAALAALVAAEKLAPAGPALGRYAGAALLLGGLALLA